MPLERKLFLDDVRPSPLGWDCVRSYAEFVDYIEKLGVPDIISFDHDLAFEHYPLEEKTGYDCAKLLVEKQQFPALAIVHSFNPVGAKNIAHLLSPYTKVIVRPYRPEF